MRRGEERLFGDFEKSNIHRGDAEERKKTNIGE
jgi:hypothetical protein